MSRTLIDRQQKETTAGLVIPAIGIASESTPSRILESQGLVEALGVNLEFTDVFKVREPNAGFLFGGGQLDQIGNKIDDSCIDMVVVDCSLSPVQQRNLERKLGVKVVDRTGLILEIFGLRARTSEGRLQVEMARILYERSRLVRTWTHLERQRGGHGFLAGPGESQLEADRRMLDGQIRRLKQSLEDVRRTRGIQRSGRRKRGNPVIAFVGYTNAGKSTLFNRLTDANVFSADMPFATLDPTVRDIELSSGDSVSLIDTVGFITDLPTTLIDSFQATIEEAIEADLLIHVRDISDAESERQAKDVEKVLGQLEQATGQRSPPIIEAWNKCDLLDDEMRLVFNSRASKNDDVVLITASTGFGVDNLLELIQKKAFEGRVVVEISLSAKDGKARAWLYEKGEVVDETVEDDGGVTIKVQLDIADRNRFVDAFSLVPLTLIGSAV